MSSSNDYILIPESRETDEESALSENKEQEGKEDSLRTLERQGISILNENEVTVSAEPRDQFSRELMNEGGIEIISSDEEEEAFL